LHLPVLEAFSLLIQLLRILIPFLTLLFSSGTAAAQTIKVGQVAKLPSSPEKSDHLVAAIHPTGHIMVAWQEARPGGGHDIALTYLNYRCNGEWKLPQTSVVVGAADADPQCAQSTCTKPGILACRDGFLVVWIRYCRENDSHLATVEGLYIDETGQAYAPAPGRGWTLSAPFFAGDSGATLSLTALKNGPHAAGAFFALSYASQVKQIDTAEGELNDYSIHGLLIDANQAQLQAFPLQTADGTESLVELARSDSLDSYNRSGRLPAFLIEDHAGALLLCYEEYLHRIRTGALTNKGKVWVRRFQWRSGGNVLEEDSKITAFGGDRTRFQRRPALSLAPASLGNRFGLAWLETKQDGSDGRGQVAQVFSKPSGLELGAQAVFLGGAESELLDSRPGPRASGLIGVEREPDAPNPEQVVFTWLPALGDSALLLESPLRFPRRPNWATLDSLPCSNHVGPLDILVVDDNLRPFIAIQPLQE